MAVENAIWLVSCNLVEHQLEKKHIQAMNNRDEDTMAHYRNMLACVRKLKNI